MTEFADSYVKFIKKLKQAVEEKKPALLVDDNNSSSLEGVFDGACDDYARTAIDYASSQLEPSVRNRLFAEINYFNGLPNNEINDKYIEDGETVKDSLEDLIGDWLPDWLKKTLKILNEILKLAKGG